MSPSEWICHSRLRLASFHRYVKNALLSADWGGDLNEIEARFGE
jgi:hypothetical protein